MKYKHIRKLLFLAVPFGLVLSTNPQVLSAQDTSTSSSTATTTTGADRDTHSGFNWGWLGLLGLGGLAGLRRTPDVTTTTDTRR